MKSCNCYCKSRLCAFSLGIAFGVVSGLFMLLFALAAYKWGHGTPLIALYADVYQGYAPTVYGAFVGAAWGFVEGFVFGLLLGWIYNLTLCCCAYFCKSSREEDVEVKVRTRKEKL